MKVGDLVILPPNIIVWSTSLQSNITFETDQIIELTNGIHGSPNFFFGQLKQLLFNIPGQIPCLIGKGSGDISLNVKGLEKYEIPKPQFIEMIYGKET